MTSRGEFVRSLFERITPRYDLLNHLLSLGLDFTWRRQAVDRSGLQAGGRALDLCTGTGDLAALLSRRVGRSGRTVGLDFCESMLAGARRKYPNLDLVTGDAHRLPFGDGEFDAITIAFGLRNLEDPALALREMGRVTAPGGRLLVLELTRPERPPMKWLYALYLHWIVPLVGGFISGDFPAYRYLADTISRFMPVEEVGRLMEEAGFSRVTSHPLSGCICTLLVGQK